METLRIDKSFEKFDTEERGEKANKGFEYSGWLVI
jgi:hypothetical protein